MKILLTLVCCTVITCSTFAQVKVKHKHNLGLSYSLMGDMDLIKFQSLDGAPSFSVDKSTVFGIVYLFQTANNWAFETGLDYGKFDVYITPAFNPDIDNTPRKTSLNLISIPLILRYNIGKYFFLNGGTVLDIQIKDERSIDDQTGLGALIGLGVKYDFNFGTSIFINPFVKAHALLPFAKERYHDHLMESGFKFGITQTF